ncbi:hypothetical protein CEY12_00865 [Chryseobacterium sp. T16E-39]|uniref:outer membrane beta-barrel protein n=1 Tax=Chryseobacterium sp. T16E-39 TaxID=2015076 RepID=UPI000B5B277B|nr:outer membrane beta-barrel protein [Chryseobacterium sp. T16E-39]ASK28750.1 hypothetical protein CEY12_00865 [Chryseobacterium sp. T16E-39]
MPLYLSLKKILSQQYIIYFIILCLLPASFKSQDLLNTENKKIYFDFGGTFGAFFPYSSTDGFKNTIGSNSVTSIQLTYNNKYFTRLKLGQTTVNYKASFSFNSLRSEVDVKTNSTNIGLDIGYQRMYGHWQPFLFAGSGIALIEEPSIHYSSADNQINYGTKSSNNLYLNFGIGVNYVISKTFIVLGECLFYTVPGISSNSLTHLNGVSPLIGIKAIL